MTILDRGNSEISGTNSQSHQLDSGKIEEVLRTFKILKRGFSEEKKMMSRLRRHVTKIQSKIVDQQNVSREFSKGIANILEAVTTVSDILNDMKNEMKDFKEKGKIMSSTISTSTQRFSQIEETLNKIQPELVDQRSVSRELLNGLANVREEVTTVSNGLNVVKTEIAELKEKTSKVNTSIQACRRIEESLDTLKITEQKMEVFHNKRRTLVLIKMNQMRCETDI